MSRTVYAVPGITPQGQELTSKEEALRLAEAHGSAVFAYRKDDDGSLRLLGTKTRKGKVIEYKNNPLKDFSMPAYAFDRELRRMGQTGHTVYRDLRTGVETKKPKIVYFGEPDAALQALAVFLVLEGVDTRGAVDMTTDRAHRKMAAIRLPNGDIYASTLSPEGNDYWIQTPHDGWMIRWGTWALAGQYPTTKARVKQNPAGSVDAGMSEMRLRQARSARSAFEQAVGNLRKEMAKKPSRSRANAVVDLFMEAVSELTEFRVLAWEKAGADPHTVNQDEEYLHEVAGALAAAFYEAQKAKHK